MDCPYCREWMPLNSRVEKWGGQDYVTILYYTCEECGRKWEKQPEGLRAIQ